MALGLVTSKEYQKICQQGNTASIRTHITQENDRVRECRSHYASQLRALKLTIKGILLCGHEITSFLYNKGRKERALSIMCNNDCDIMAPDV